MTSNIKAAAFGTIVALALSVAAPQPAVAEAESESESGWGWGSIARFTQNTAAASARLGSAALDRTGSALGAAADQTGAALGAAVDQTGAALGAAVDQTGAALGAAVDQTGAALGAAVDQTGAALGAAADWTGEATGDALQWTGETAKAAADFTIDAADSLIDMSAEAIADLSRRSRSAVRGSILSNREFLHDCALIGFRLESISVTLGLVPTASVKFIDAGETDVTAAVLAKYEGDPVRLLALNTLLRAREIDIPGFYADGISLNLRLPPSARVVLKPDPF